MHESQQQPNVGRVDVEQMAQSLSNEPQLCPGYHPFIPSPLKHRCALYSFGQLGRNLFALRWKMKPV